MKEIYLDNNKIKQRFRTGPEGSRLASTVEEAADLVTLGKAALVEDSFLAHEVEEYFYSPTPTT